jgi:hypothetical protein
MASSVLPSLTQHENIVTLSLLKFATHGESMARRIIFTLPFAVAVVLMALAGLPGRLSACSMGNEPFAIDLEAAAVDREAPGVIGAVEVRVRRGVGETREGCLARSSNSNDDLGSITLSFEPPVDDRTAWTDFGYRFRVVEGEPPGVEGLPEHPVRGHLNTQLVEREGEDPRVDLYLEWDDGSTDDQEPLAFVLEVIPLDLAGNEGPPTLVVVNDAGSWGGCAVANRPEAMAAYLILATIVVLAVSRRRGSVL